MNSPTATHDHSPGGLAETDRFVRSTRWMLRDPWKVRVGKDWYRIFDVNMNFCEVRGIGFADPDIVTLLRLVGAAYDPETIHEPTDLEYKELLTGRRYPWAHDRAM